MRTCLFCNNFGKIIVTYNYGNSTKTVKDKIYQILGAETEDCLTDHDTVCHNCKNGIENIIRLQEFIWEQINRNYDDDERYEKRRVNEVWELFSSVNIEEEPENASYNLITPAYTTAYVPRYERSYNEAERQRSISRASYVSKVSNTNLEVAEIFRKTRRKRKGHNWSRRKRSQSANVTRYPRSNPSRRSLPRAYSDYERRYSTYSDLSDDSDRPYFIQDSKDTRLSRQRRENQKEEEITCYYCDIGDCTMFFPDVEDLSEHHLDDHKCLAMYFCEECGKKFIKQEYLKIHSQSHNETSILCFMCGIECASKDILQSHLEEHIIYSVPCNYCDKSFLCTTVCEEHIKKVHKRGAQRVRLKTYNLHPERIDKTDTPENNYDYPKSTTPSYEVHYVNMDKQDEPMFDQFTLPLLRRMNSSSEQVKSIPQEENTEVEEITENDKNSSKDSISKDETNTEIQDSEFLDEPLDRISENESNTPTPSEHLDLDDVSVSCEIEGNDDNFGFSSSDISEREGSISPVDNFTKTCLEYMKHFTPLVHLIKLNIDEYSKN